MRVTHIIAAGLAALSIAAGAAPAQAATNTAAPDTATAEKVRKLDIMLMVSALRCRHTPYGFQADYNSFASNHLGELNAAHHALQASMVQQHGTAGAKRAMDKLSVSMAGPSDDELRRAAG